MQARRQAVRRQVLQTAADLFRERGYRATTLDDLAARLGMSKASLYTYVRSKEELLAAISRETIGEFRREMDRVLHSDLDPDEKLRRIVRRHVEFVIGRRSFLTVFFSEEANLPPRLARALAAQKDRYDKALERLIAAGVRAGVFRDVEPRLVVFGLLGMLNWLYKWYRPAGAWGPEEIAGAFVDLLERGLVRRPAPRRLRPRLARLRRELAEVARLLEER
ncbi:MAG: TetR/AcrR family transcriptional regulator [Candidatus Rokubacteria bacterium]|nr:TetR/AcrR family transcriptional regulator [Candidatus Rokubacteria bacterium]